MSADQVRRARENLLDPRNPGDAMAAYYAYYHDRSRTQILTAPESATASNLQGFVTVSRTGIDLFRPLLTMRLPIHDLETSAGLLRRALPAEHEAFVVCPVTYEPLVRALYEVRTEQRLALYTLDKSRFKSEMDQLNITMKFVPIVVKIPPFL